MINGVNTYLELVSNFKAHNKILYLVGGTVRDILLKKDVFDFDLVTDALPSLVLSILSNYNPIDTFIDYGVIQLKVKGIHFDIVTLRKEKIYKDFRHPLSIKFVTSIKTDVKRRDFTINGLYMNDRFEVIDFVNGIKDLNNHILRTIGRPSKRLKEDPLRILRALRFSLMYNLEIEKKLDKAIKKYSKLVNKLSNDKILSEFKKIKGVGMDKIEEIYHKYNLINFIKKEGETK